MGMHFTGCSCHIVKEDFVKSICPQEFQDFLEAMNENPEDLSQGDIVYELEFGDMENIDPVMQKAYTALVDAFKKETANKSKGAGFDLTIGFHSKDDCGDADDDVDGIFWSIDFGSIFDYTPTGLFFKDHIQLARFVEYG